MDKIGPTFADEVHAAGLGGLDFSWGADGSFFGREKLTKEQNITLDMLIAAHDSSKEAAPGATLVESLIDKMVQKGILSAADKAEIVPPKDAITASKPLGQATK